MKQPISSFAQRALNTPALYLDIQKDLDRNIDPKGDFGKYAVMQTSVDSKEKVWKVVFYYKNEVAQGGVQIEYHFGEKEIILKPTRLFRHLNTAYELDGGIQAYQVEQGKAILDLYEHDKSWEIKVFKA